MTRRVATARLRLRPFEREDRTWFAALHADGEVMRDTGAPLTADESAAKLARYVASSTASVTGRLAVETSDGTPVGYTGVMAGPADHPLGAHLQTGWRFLRRAWGHGYATEAAAGALRLQFGLRPDREVLAYTAADNLRSQRVMARLGLRRDPSRDFTAYYGDTGDWRGLVWVADPPAAPRWT